jgi:hypothetical protein
MGVFHPASGHGFWLDIPVANFVELAGCGSRIWG